MSVARAVTATFAKFPLTVTTAGVGAGTVRGPGITCVWPAAVGRDCTETYAARAVVRLTATPAAGSGFVGWSGACTGTDDCTVTMSVARAVTATFAKFPLTVTTAGVGAGTVRGPGITCVRPAAVGRDCTETYAARAVVRLTATPAAGSGFAGWSGACTGTDDCTVTMSVARAVTATFAKFPLTVTTAGVGAGSPNRPRPRHHVRAAGGRRPGLHRDLRRPRRREIDRHPRCRLRLRRLERGLHGHRRLHGDDERRPGGHRDLREGSRSP